MNNFCKLLIFQFLCSLFFINTSRAQDPGFSQFEGNKLYINPASAGTSMGLNINAVYRSQWNNIKGGFQTPKLSIDFGFNKNFGMGLYIMQDNEGNSLKTTAAGLGLSGSISGYDNSSKSYFDIRAGIMAFYVCKKLDFNNLIFSDQLDQINGYNNHASSFTVPQEFLKINYFELSTGLNFIYTKPKFEIEIGGSIHHWPKPKQSFVGLETKLPNKYAIYADLKFIMGERYIYPYISLALQSPFKQILLGFNTTLIYPGIIAGLSFRQSFTNSDALILMCGYETNLNRESRRKKNSHFIRVLYSYDMTISKLSNSSGGSHEISLGYVYKYIDRCPLNSRNNWQMRNFWKDKKILRIKKGGKNNRNKTY